MIEKILVAVDGSEPSEHALNQAVEHAVKWSAKLVIVSVIPPISRIAYTLPAPTYIDQYKKDASNSHQTFLNKACTKVNKENPDIRVETRLEEGRPADVIVETAKEEDVDLIVMGSRGLGGVAGWVLGSTSRHVVEVCTKPILIVK